MNANSRKRFFYIGKIQEIWITADSSENFEWSMENGVVSFEQVLLANEEHPFTYLEVDDPKERTSLICYTSGSTGLPKGVELTHTNVVASMLSHGYVEYTNYLTKSDLSERKLYLYSTERET